MASIIDEMMAREGSLDLARAGIDWAQAADREWVRWPTETERDFIGRVRAEAAAEGFRVVHIGGAIQTRSSRSSTPLLRIPLW
jgi:hypothetical protein